MAQVVLITAYARDGDLEDDVPLLTKPFDIDQLVQAIGRGLRDPEASTVAHRSREGAFVGLLETDPGDLPRGPGFR